MGNWVRTKAPKLTDGITTEKMAHHQAFKYSIKMLSCQLTKLNRMWLAITSAWFLWANMGNRFAAWTFAAMIESIENLSSRREWEGWRGAWRRGISLCRQSGGGTYVSGVRGKLGPDIGPWQNGVRWEALFYLIFVYILTIEGARRWSTCL